MNAQWKGKSGLNLYADFVMETDAVVGQILDAIDRNLAADQTLVIFTSDNGTAPYVGALDLAKQGHYCSGPLRGYKSDVWEGGHRVPLIVRWPGHVAPKTVCDKLVHQADLMATCAAVTGAELPDSAGEDSFSLLPLLKGSDAPVRQHAVSQASSGLSGVRQGAWKLIFGPGSGGWGKGADEHPAQLYNLRRDVAETNNLFADRPDKVSELTALMARLVNDGRSTPGTAQKNAQPVNWQRFMQE